MQLKILQLYCIINVVVYYTRIFTFMDKKIFISHAAADAEIGEKFLDFLISLGYDKKKIFYSSKYHNGVEIGKNFPNVVRDNFIDADIIVLLLTKNFYNSYYCVCEEGAAWISQDKEIVPVLLGDLNFNDMQGFIDSSTKSFSPKHSETEELFSFFAKRINYSFDQIEAKKKYYDFLETSVGVSNIKDKAILNEKEVEILTEISQSPNAYAIYSDLMNIIQINCNNKKLCDGLDTLEKLEYKSAMEHLLKLGLVERRRRKHTMNFIYLTGEGAAYLNDASH